MTEKAFSGKNKSIKTLENRKELRGFPEDGRQVGINMEKPQPQKIKSLKNNKNSDNNDGHSYGTYICQTVF